jgi:hypothetical protein
MQAFANAAEVHVEITPENFQSVKTLNPMIVAQLQPEEADCPATGFLPMAEERPASLFHPCSPFRMAVKYSCRASLAC